MTELMELTDAEDAAVDAAIADPSLILTTTRAEEILEYIETEISDIGIQLESTKVEVEIGGPLPPDRQVWLRRATSAFVWKKRQKQAVVARMKELQPASEPQIEALPKGIATPAERAETRIREMEIMLQIQREKDAAKMQRIEWANKQQIDTAQMFVRTAAKLLPPETLADIWRQAREAFPDNPNWL